MNRNTRTAILLRYKCLVNCSILLLSKNRIFTLKVKQSWSHFLWNKMEGSIKHLFLEEVRQLNLTVANKCYQIFTYFKMYYFYHPYHERLFLSGRLELSDEIIVACWKSGASRCSNNLQNCIMGNWFLFVIQDTL